MKSKDAHCFLWNETVAGRGANEIASHLATYLVEADEHGFEVASLFCDGCAGQNKNSVMCAMMMNVLKTTRHLNEVTIFYFETNHGQSEGDSVHSVVERAMTRAGEMFVPSQLSTLVSLACSRRYRVVDVCSEDILDYKVLAQSMGILRVRVSEEGTSVKWPGIMQLRVSKASPDTIQFKMSHQEQSFQTLRLSQRRTVIAPLENLCNGTHPVIRSPEHVAFYRNIRHWSNNVANNS